MKIIASRAENRARVRSTSSVIFAHSLKSLMFALVDFCVRHVRVIFYGTPVCAPPVLMHCLFIRELFRPISAALRLSFR